MGWSAAAALGELGVYLISHVPPVTWSVIAAGDAATNLRFEPSSPGCGLFGRSFLGDQAVYLSCRVSTVIHYMLLKLVRNGLATVPPMLWKSLTKSPCLQVIRNEAHLHIRDISRSYNRHTDHHSLRHTS